MYLSIKAMYKYISGCQASVGRVENPEYLTQKEKNVNLTMKNTLLRQTDEVLLSNYFFQCG